jgi:hypothetical protein
VLKAHHEYACTITCDVCGAVGHYRSHSGEGVDALLEQDGWKRFGPSGQDLCHKCTGASPNTIIQVRKP